MPEESVPMSLEGTSPHSALSVSLRHSVLLFAWIVLVAFFFAKLEIQIEGSAGWAGNLPTWRVEQHWLLDIFWGGRALTGYHAWAFSFMALIFHLPLFLFGAFSWRLEARVLASLMYFWIIEDFLWFIFNPAYGIEKFQPQNVPWHKHWLWIVPTDYVTFLAVGTMLFWWSFRTKKPV